MAVANASLVAFTPNSSPSTSHSLYSPRFPSKPLILQSAKTRVLSTSTFALKGTEIRGTVDLIEHKNDAVLEESSETVLYSFSPLNLLLLAALPGGDAANYIFLKFS